MRTAGDPDAEDTLRRHEAGIARDLRGLAERRARHQAQIAELTERRERVLDQLAAQILPSLDEADCERAASLIAFDALTASPPGRALERERRELEARLAEIEADARWREREALVAPHTGSLSSELAELDEFRQALLAANERVEHPRLARLIASGYDTDAYTEHFWNAGYHHDRAAAAEIVARFPGQRTFAEIRADYLKARETLAFYEQRRREVRKAIDQTNALATEHDQATAALDGLGAQHLATWRQRLRQHVADMGWAGLAAHLIDAPDELALARRWSGLGHQISTIDQLVSWKLMELESVLTGEQRRLRLALDRVEQADVAPGLRDPTALEPPRWERAEPDIEERLAALSDECDAAFQFSDYDAAGVGHDSVWSELLSGRDQPPARRR